MYKWSAITKWSEWSLMFSGGRGLGPSAEAAKKPWKSLNTGSHLLIVNAEESIEDSVSRPCEPCFIIVSRKIHSQWCVIDVTKATGQNGPEKQMESRGTVYNWQMHKMEKLNNRPTDVLARRAFLLRGQLFLSIHFSLYYLK